MDAGLDCDPVAFCRSCLCHASLISFFHACWIKISTLIIAGTFFLLSVSEVFIPPRRRIAFILFVSAAAVLYLTVLMACIHTVDFYVPCSVISLVTACPGDTVFTAGRAHTFIRCFFWCPTGMGHQRAMRGLLARNEFLSFRVLLRDRVWSISAIFADSRRGLFSLPSRSWPGAAFFPCRNSCRARYGAWSGKFFLGLAKILRGFWNDSDAV